LFQKGHQKKTRENTRILIEPSCFFTVFAISLVKKPSEDLERGREKENITSLLPSLLFSPLS